MAQGPEFDQIAWKHRDELNREIKRLFSKHSSEIAASTDESDVQASLTDLREEIEGKTSDLIDKLLESIKEEHKSAAEWKDE